MKIGVIPARWGSKRFPGKPMTPILGKPMVEWVYDAAKASELDTVMVATDDLRILAADVSVTMTGECESGTERCLAAFPLRDDDDIIVNIQGDEPCITPDLINEVLRAVEGGADVATLCHSVDLQTALNPDVVKVAVDVVDDALYFSRCPIPHGSISFKAHIGIYGYRFEMLKWSLGLPHGRNEILERLEQLRILDAGCKIKVIPVKYDGHGVDRPADVPVVEEILTNR